MSSKNTFMTTQKHIECPICIEKMTKSKEVKCNFCNYTACQKCTETYLTSSADDPNCMNCKRLWDREHLLKLLPKVFVNGELKKHRENMLLERETAMMPTTQPYVEQELKKRQNQVLLNKLNLERQRLKRKLHDINRLHYDVQMNLIPDIDREKRSFVQRCGDPECRGYLSNAWKCNICQKYTCSECNVVKGENRDAEHVCDENDKLCMQAIKKEAKKCPGCGEYISKIDGCDQMWCICCHTAFSWRTGLVVNGTVHNPHFYDFQRRHGTLNRNIGDIPCGGLVSYRALSISLGNVSRNPTLSKRDNDIIFVYGLHRVTAHMEHDELPRYNSTMTENNNRDLRVRYMLNEISTDVFKQKIQQREKAHNKKREISMILNMYIITVSDYMRDILHKQTVYPMISDLKELVNYTNKCLIVISTRYDCVVPIIKPEMKVITATSKMKIDLL